MERDTNIKEASRGRSSSFWWEDSQRISCGGKYWDEMIVKVRDLQCELGCVAGGRHGGVGGRQGWVGKALRGKAQRLGIH